MKDVITERKSPYLFITGGAGVGKTLLLHILYNSLSRHYNVLLNANPDQKNNKKKPVLKIAFAGKAAYLIFGNSIHSTLGIKGENLSESEYSESSMSEYQMYSY